jgi:hypothetical protein
MKLWVKAGGSTSEGKFLVVRRDGSIPCWPHFVMGARDPAVPAALRAYAQKGDELGYDPEYTASVRELADDFDAYREKEGPGDADAVPHRKDDPEIVKIMQGDDGQPVLWHSSHNARKGP